MKMLLTGGSGNLGQTLVPKLLYRGDTPVILDVRPPRHLKGGALFIEGSAVREGPKVCRLPAGAEWIRTSGSARDKGSVPRLRFAPKLMATDGSLR